MWHPQWHLNNGIWVNGVKAYAHDQAKARSSDEEKPTAEERRAEEMKRFVEGKRSITPDKHADGCECPRCKPEEWK